MDFLTKAETLSKLQKRVKKSEVLPSVIFEVGDIEEEGVEKQAANVLRAFQGQPVIVRSSARNEDCETESRAGQYLSIGNCKTEVEIKNAIYKVKDAFGKDGDKKNQIFVQPMIEHSICSGVMFTLDPNNGGNYYVINYDNETGSTSSVTSGNGERLKTQYIFKAYQNIENQFFKRLVEASAELEAIFERNNLDIEFAFDGKNKLYLLQVRPLVVKSNAESIDEQSKTLKRIYDKIQNAMRPKLALYGKRTIYGVMPDWNPAEMIGIKPRELALSLYKKLITDGIWAYQRDNYGYKNLRSFPLMMDFAGMPFIDVRVSFNSFIPKGIPEELGDKLVEYYLTCLEKEPGKHDKVEFDIILSCYTFNLKEKLNNLKEAGFSTIETEILEKELLKLTNHIINTKDGLWITDMEKIEILEEKRVQILKSDMDIISKIYWFIENCERYGTLPFAGLARAGFIAVLMLKSLVEIGVLSMEEYDCYMRSLNTVSSMMTQDKTNLSKAAFMKKYGHLRPGTYDIMMNRYTDDVELYYGKEEDSQEQLNIKFALSLEQYETIQNLMIEHGIEGDVLALFKFLKAGIEGREYAKFTFTKTLSEILELLAQFGNEYGLSREEMADIDIQIIDKLYSSVDDAKALLMESAKKGRQKYLIAQKLNLPSIILQASEIYCFSLLDSIPNYITQLKTEGNISELTENRADLKDKILLIDAADPGYDWIFTCGIRGFVTMYGGVNSHMAIRAGELGMPAVIGAGTKMMQRLRKSRYIVIDCAKKSVTILN